MNRERIIYKTKNYLAFEKFFSETKFPIKVRYDDAYSKLLPYFKEIYPKLPDKKPSYATHSGFKHYNHLKLSFYNFTTN